MASAPPEHLYLFGELMHMNTDQQHLFMKIDLNKIRTFGNIELLARQMVEGFITGLHKSPYHGFSVEFAEHRLYNAGESTRYIDWKVFAKTDRLYTKRFEEETNLRCQLLLDTSSSMFYPRETNGKITFSIMAAATLCYLLQKQRDALGLTTFSDEIEVNTPTKSTATHMHKIFLQLENLLHKDYSGKQTSIAKVLHQIAEKIHKRSLVILFTDMFDQNEQTEEIFSALLHLKHKKHEVLLFHVTDKKTEMDFEFEDRPYEFIDMESGEKIKLQPSQIRDSYRKEMKDFYVNLKMRCGQYKIDLIEADINEGFEQVLSAYLIKRSKMR